MSGITDPDWIPLETSKVINEANMTSIASGSAAEGVASSASSSVCSTTSDPADGELGFLFSSLDDEESVPLNGGTLQVLKRTMSGTCIEENMDGVYGFPLSPEEAADRMPPHCGGLTWNATIIPDDFFDAKGNLKRGLSKRDFDFDRRAIKPRRAHLVCTLTEFFSSVTKIGGPNGPRYIFYGVLNGWPALRCLELMGVEERRQTNIAGIPSPKELIAGQVLWKKIWDVTKEGVAGVDPQNAIPKSFITCRIKLQGAPWTANSWSSDSLGFVYWYEASHPLGPRFSFGTDLVKLLGDDRCSHIHMISHRYAVTRESTRDRLTYHSIALLEWEHGLYCTVVELAYLNGLGGYKGKSNWVEDKDENITGLYQAMPPEMICPWLTSQAEIRCVDVKSKNLEEFKQYMEKYKGADKRFIDPQFSFSHPARLTFRSKSQIAQYLINYITRDASYGDLKRNCQTFCADFCAFLAGKRDIAPYHPVSRIDFQNRTYYFMYDSHMYESREKKKKNKLLK